MVLIIVVGAALMTAVAGKVVPRAGAWLLENLTGWGLLVSNPLLALPGTEVGLDAARLVVIGGVLVAIGARASRRRRRDGEQ